MISGPIDAMPTKELFIDTLVRDVSLKDAILDLVDNAIDGYLRSKYGERKKIKIRFSKTKFEIWDNCGGINAEYTQKEVFRFGVTSSKERKTLGVYGIGLKRSIFKMGSKITFESDDLRNYFRIKINLEEWKKDPQWKFYFDDISDSNGNAFTNISITELNDETKNEFSKDSFKNELKERIGKTYFLFIRENVDISVNDVSIEPFELKVGFSKEIKPANKLFKVDDVNVKLTAGAHPDFSDPGWYVFCNNRLIILGERTSLTGWGERGVPIYHSKFNRFKGFAYISATDPAKLPWNTAKNGLDTSSMIYVRMLDEMQTMTQQYTRFMSKAYPTESEETIGKEILGELETTSPREIEGDQLFVAPTIPLSRENVTINYKKPRGEVDRLKKSMDKKSMSNRELGERTFDYYKEMECPDEE